MPWALRIKKKAQKQIRKLSRSDRERIAAALNQMLDNPFAGDVMRLRGIPGDFRHRVGSYRIFFTVEPAARVLNIHAVRRRQTTTYKR